VIDKNQNIGPRFVNDKYKNYGPKFVKDKYIKKNGSKIFE